MYPIIFPSSCRRHNRLSVKGRNLSKYGKVVGERGGGEGGERLILPPCNTVGGRVRMYVEG